ncbi:MAG TPA: hypothetical protein VIA18_15540 [Polyangia bacterium]|jgi:hypothetical protein|nr:hypothetical protein [Polyangia bacterium]HWE29356.1 hypothetical protein [Polyangia bacterium]
MSIRDAAEREVWHPRAMEHVKPIVTVDLDHAGKPIGAVAVADIEAPRSRVWSVIANLDGYAGVVPMLDKVKRQGDRVTVHLRFKISLVSVGFEFTCALKMEHERWLELTWVAGEPKGLRIRFDLEDTESGTTQVKAGIWFDALSLGWLAKYFLRHHPEIQFGIFPGCALAIVDSMRRVSEGQK